MNLRLSFRSAFVFLLWLASLDSTAARAHSGFAVQQQAREPIKCGTGMLISLQQSARYSKSAAVAAAMLSERPALAHSFATSDGRFRIHYTTSGTDAVDPTSTNILGIPDYVYEAALAATYAHHVLIDSLGYREPASDGGRDGQEFDIYIINRAGQDYGYTVPETAVPGALGRYAAFCVVDNDFSQEENYFTPGVNGLRVTVAHEYFHAVQLNYQLREEDIFFLETSSVWFEDVAYNDINDYVNYLPPYFRMTSLPLNTQNNSHEYGNGLWLHYLVKRFDIHVVRRIWEQIETTQALLANRNVLVSLGQTLGDAFSEFAQWMFFTGYRADAMKYFSESASYPLVSFDRTQNVQTMVTLTDSVRNLATRFYRFVSSSPELTVAHLSNQPGRWMFTTINGNNQLGYELQKSIGGTALGMQHMTPGDTVVVIVSNTSLPSSVTLPYYLIPTFKYSLEINSASFETDNTVLAPRPNPFIPGTGEYLILPVRLQASSPLELFIVREDGRRVRHYDLGLRSAGTHQMVWDGLDDHGDTVASGIYILQIVAGSFRPTAKVAVIHR